MHVPTTTILLWFRRRLERQRREKEAEAAAQKLESQAKRTPDGEGGQRRKP